MATDKTPLAPKLLLGLIVLVAVLFVAWLTYSSINRAGPDADEPEAVTTSPESQVESPSRPAGGEPPTPAGDEPLD